jgi:dihydropyrimidinase
MQPFDLVIRGGTVATATDSMRADVGIRGSTVAAIAENLDKGKREIDARGKLVLPGGVDSHSHIQQLSASGLINADTFESATTAAAFGGTTTVISFAAQHVGMSLKTVVDEYHELAERGAVVDYAFHMILADPREEVLEKEVPPLVKAGHASLKVFMTYDRLKVDDEQLLNVLQSARDNRAMVCVHAENHGMISWMGKRLIKHGHVAPKFHAISHPRYCEPEAFTRLIACAALVDQPIMIFHVSTAEGAAVIRKARGEGLKVFAETCPQYLFLTKHDLDKPGLEGAKWIFSPPARDASDHDALWQALALGDLQVISSDHAPYAFDKTGKLVAGKKANFKQIPNGMPGLEARLPVVFDEMVSNGRFDVSRFVEWTATSPAKIYGLYPKKGTLAIGSDADIAIWDPKKRVTFQDRTVKDRAGFTPWKGRTVRGWPTTVLLRGEVLVADDRLHARPGSGQFLARKAGQSAQPLGRLAPEFDPKRNFGVKLG